MLVFTRKKDESIIITCPTGEVIKIIVNDIMGNKIRVGIEAPKHIPVNRNEVQEVINNANRNS
jgi:carbon storage regulator